MLCQPLSNELHRMPIYGQTLSKQGRGAKWLTIRDTQTFTNKPRPTPMESSNRNVVMELGKRKAAVVILRPMKRARSISLASLPQEATKSMRVYKICGSPKRKGYRPKQLLRDFKKTSKEG